MVSAASSSTPPGGHADLPAAEDQVWRLLQRGVADRHAASRHPSLVTVDADGQPQVRTLVLRRVERDARALLFHSDRRSAKVRALSVNSACAVHVYDARRRVQLRIRGQAQILHDDPSVDAEWQRLSPSSRHGYAVLATPGDPAESAQDDTHGDEAWARAQFCCIRVTVQAIEALWLRPLAHLRARFGYDPPMAPQWLVP